MIGPFRTAFAAALLCSACLGPLDIFGNQTVVTEDEDYLKQDQLEDDRIEDKHPVYDPALVVEERFGDHCTVSLNKSGSVTELDVIPFDDDHAALAGQLFPDRGAAAAALAGTDIDLIPSMEVVNGKLKPFDDGLYAAIESDLQDGVDGLLSERQWLYDLLAALTARVAEASPVQAARLDQARAMVAAALLAGGNLVEVPAAVDGEARSALADFLAVPQWSRPVGFYTWSELLGEVFAQDRLLQNQGSRFDFGAFAAIAVVLGDQPELLEQYQTLHALYGGLTNPYVSYTPLEILPYVDGLSSLDDVAAVRTLFEADNQPLVTCSGPAYALLPASRSKDTAYFDSRWCTTGVPEGTNMIDELISAIRNGAVDLAPGPDAGWYDYQLWALETLLLPERGPESDHLLLTAAYKQKLLDTFKSIITQNRETHVKQVQPFGPTSAPSEPIDIYPNLPVEPFPTFYLRTARGLRFLGTYLEAVLGGDYLAAAGRVKEQGGRAEVALADELDQEIELLYGLYLLSSDSVGLDPQAYLLADELAEIDPERAREAARSWLEEWRLDPDVRVDPRVIVPVASDDGTGRGVYWAIFGVGAIQIRAEFVEGFEPEVVHSGCPVEEIIPRDYFLLVERMEEVRFAGPPPTRDEFRAVCDRHDNVEDIIADLEDGL